MTAITTTTPRTTTATPRLDQVLAGLGTKAEALGGHALRYGLVLVLLWIGGMKFTAYEAEGIRPFVELGQRGPAGEERRAHVCVRICGVRRSVGAHGLDLKI